MFQNKLIPKMPRLYSVFLLSIMLCSSLSAEENVNQFIQKEKESRNYGTHLVTGSAAQVSFLIAFACGFLVGDIALDNNLDTWIYRNLKFQPPLDEGCLNTNFGLICSVGGTPALVGLLAGLYLMYKTPQWTDTYILKENDVRTFKQNVIAFLNRAFIVWPFGILSGEFFSHENKD